MFLGGPWVKMQANVATEKLLRRSLGGGVLLAALLGVLSGVTAGAAPPPAGPRCPLTPGEGGDPFYRPNAPVRSHVGTGFVLTRVVRSVIACSVLLRSAVEFSLRT